jgi:hypothetical protein
MGAGMNMLCKLYGKLISIDDKGNKVIHVWDYANDKAMLESEMTKEMTAASEKAKYEMIKKASDAEFAKREMDKNLNDTPF